MGDFLKYICDIKLINTNNIKDLLKIYSILFYIIYIIFNNI